MQNDYSCVIFSLCSKYKCLYTTVTSQRYVMLQSGNKFEVFCSRKTNWFLAPQRDSFYVTAFIFFINFSFIFRDGLTSVEAWSIFFSYLQVNSSLVIYTMVYLWECVCVCILSAYVYVRLYECFSELILYYSTLNYLLYMYINRLILLNIALFY